MIHKIYFNKKLPFPIVSLTLVITCIVVSLSAHFVPQYDAVLNALEPVTYWWQRFTSFFTHGGYWAVPIEVHLTGNMAGILVFSILCERVLSPKKYWRFFLISLGASVLAFYGFKMTGNGISSLVWSYSPITAYVIFILLKEHRKNIKRVPVILVSLFLIWCVAIYPFVFGNNNLHNMGTIIGIIFTIMWRKEIRETVCKIILDEDTVTSKKLYKPKICVLGIPVFFLSIMLLTNYGFIETVEPIRIQPENQGTFEDIKNNNNRIELVFEKEMGSEFDTLTTKSEFDVGAKVHYVDSKTIQIEFTKNIEGSKYINIVGDLATKDGFRYPVKLNYHES